MVVQRGVNYLKGRCKRGERKGVIGEREKWRDFNLAKRPGFTAHFKKTYQIVTVVVGVSRLDGQLKTVSVVVVLEVLTMLKVVVVSVKSCTVLLSVMSVTSIDVDVLVVDVVVVVVIRDVETDVVLDEKVVLVDAEMSDVMVRVVGMNRVTVSVVVVRVDSVTTDTLVVVVVKEVEVWVLVPEKGSTQTNGNKPEVPVAGVDAHCPQKGVVRLSLIK